MPLAPPPQLQRRRIEPLDLGERLAEPHDDARHAAVADDQIGAEAERHHRHRRIELGEEAGEIVGILRLEQPFRRAARLEPDQRRQRRVGGELAGHLGEGRGAAHPRRPRLADAVGAARRPFGDVAGAEADDHVARRGEPGELAADVVGVGRDMRAEMAALLQPLDQALVADALDRRLAGRDRPARPARCRRR